SPRSAQLASLILSPSRFLVVRTIETTRDDRPQDVVGSFPDSHQGRIAVEPLDLVFGRVAVAAVDAHRLQGGLDADLRGVELRHSGFEVGPLPGVKGRRGPP